MRIVYYLMTHDEERLVRRITGRLLAATSTALVLIHHDAKNSPLTIDPGERVQFVTPVEVRWGDISLVRAMWRAFEWLDGWNEGFDWVIFISGHDYPIRPLSAIAQELATTNADAFVAHERIHGVPGFDTRPYQALCRERYFFRRGVGNSAGKLVPRPHPFTNVYKCFAGSQWLNVSRRAVEYLWSVPNQYDELVSTLGDASVPDETVFQTLLVNNPALTIVNTDKRFTVWRDDADHPEVLTEEDLRWILPSDAWFARKVTEKASTELMWRLDEHARV